MTTSRGFWHHVINDAGYVVLRPNVGDPADLLQQEPPNPFTESQYQQFPLGTRAIRGVEEWLYCKNAANAFTVLGTPIQAAAVAHAEMPDDIVVGASAAIGDTEVTLTSTANLATAPLSTKDGIKEGYLIVNDVDGQGQLRKIKSHEAFNSTDPTLIKLYDPLTVALTTSSQVGLLQHPCSNIIATAAVLSGMFIGVNELALTASYYFWAKVKGPAPAVLQAAIALGTYVVVGTTAAKFDPSAALTTEIIVGECATVGVADTEQCIVYLYGR